MIFGLNPDTPHCIGCLEPVHNREDCEGEDGSAILLCKTCGHIMMPNGKGYPRDLTREEWKSLPNHKSFDAIIRTRDEITERMIG